MNSNDFFFDVARGARSGYTPIHAFGNNADVDAAEDVGAGAFVFSAVAASLEIDSDSTDDDGAPVGTGARTCLVEGVDADWVYKSQTVTMNGTTAVALTGTWLRVNKVTVATAGSTGSNVGTVVVRVVAGATWATVPPTQGESDGAYYSVPAGYRLLVTSVQASVSSAGTITVGLSASENGVAKSKIPFVFALGSSPFIRQLDVPLAFGGRTDVALRVSAVSAGNQVVSGGFIGVLLSAAAV